MSRHTNYGGASALTWTCENPCDPCTPLPFMCWSMTKVGGPWSGSVETSYFTKLLRHAFSIPIDAARFAFFTLSCSQKVLRLVLNGKPRVKFPLLLRVVSDSFHTLSEVSSAHPGSMSRLQDFGAAVHSAVTWRSCRRILTSVNSSWALSVIEPFCSISNLAMFILFPSSPKMHGGYVFTTVCWVAKIGDPYRQ